jgi:hypothetical protein
MMHVGGIVPALKARLQLWRLLLILGLYCRRVR